MLGLLLSLGLFGGAAVKNAYDNAAMKNYSTEYDEDGNCHYMDNRGNMYINGERYIVKGYTDNDGVYHRQYIGVHSNKVHRDYVCPSEQLKKKYDEEDKEYCRKNGFPAYPAYNPRFKRKVTTEFETGKVVAAVVWFHNIFTQENHWVKFYVKSDAKEYEYDTPGEYDKGIEITKEEAELYDRILGKSHSSMAFGNKIWDGFDTRKPEGWDEAHRKK